MTDRQFESIMHPIRIRLIAFLTRTGTATTQELARACPNVPPATLYRHIARLRQDHIFEVARENKVNGITEKVYRMKADLLGTAEKTAAPDALMGLFCQFLMTMFGDMQRYSDRGRIDPRTDGVGFRSRFLRLTDDELDQFIGELYALLEKWEDREAGDRRQLRRFSTILVPIDED